MTDRNEDRIWKATMASLDAKFVVRRRITNSYLPHSDKSHDNDKEASENDEASNKCLRSNMNDPMKGGSDVLSGLIRDWLLNPLITRIDSLRRIIEMNQHELAQELVNVTEKVNKIGTETTALLGKVDELQAAIEQAGNVTPEVQTALDALKAQAQTVDDLVPDATAPAPAPAPTPEPGSDTGAPAEDGSTVTP
jgi:hypothetical protein